MNPVPASIGVLGWLGVALSLPLPGTTSRGRDFCDAWLRQPASAQMRILHEAEAREQSPVFDRNCRAGLRAGLRHRLTSECRNWSALMDFEIRAVVDGLLEPCREKPAGP